MRTVCKRKPTALQVLTENIVEQFLKLGVERLGEDPGVWEGVLAQLYGVACTLTGTLARVPETLLLISPSMRNDQQVAVEKAHDLMPSLVQYVEVRNTIPPAFSYLEDPGGRMGLPRPFVVTRRANVQPHRRPVFSEGGRGGLAGAARHATSYI